MALKSGKKKKKQRSSDEEESAAPKKAPRKSYKKVVATAKGYYDLKIRNPGDVFKVPHDYELASWMIDESDYEAPEDEESESSDDDGESSGDEDVV